MRTTEQLAGRRSSLLLPGRVPLLGAEALSNYLALTAVLMSWKRPMLIIQYQAKAGTQARAPSYCHRRVDRLLDAVRVVHPRP